MKKLIPIIILSLIINIANAQIQSLAGPRFGMVYISASPGSTFLNGDLALDDVFDGVSNYNDIAKGAITSLYGWQFESRFADGGNVHSVLWNGTDNSGNAVASGIYLYKMVSNDFAKSHRITLMK